ncbi:MAG TPA: hypothetical protein HPP76_05965 [Desulfuromonadales bacterium]|nr:hypothetical protein [Desulfuromonadales bacterium]
MATVNYSIPDDVKELFNTAFAGANRSAVISGLMQQAAEHELRLKHRRESVDSLLADRATVSQVTTESVSAAREEMRR